MKKETPLEQFNRMKRESEVNKILSSSMLADSSKSFFAWEDIKDKLPDDGAYHIVAWKLPSPDGTDFVYGTGYGVYDNLGKNGWHRMYENFPIPIHGVTHWAKFPKHPCDGRI